MVRLHYKDNQVIGYEGSGRSFYLCYDCINSTKKIKKITKRFKEDEDRFVKLLKELVKNG